VQDVDREALNAAADRGLLSAFWAARRPDRTAIFSEHGDRTFAEVDGDANRLVRALFARGVRPGDGVALLCANRPEFAESVVAVRRAGGIHVFNSLNYFFTINEMVIPGSSYWNIGIGRQPGEVNNDEEGLQTMKNLGKNMAWLLKKIRS